MTFASLAYRAERVLVTYLHDLRVLVARQIDDGDDGVHEDESAETDGHESAETRPERLLALVVERDRLAENVERKQELSQ